uniref:Uncharacterized protein n=1 Tax=Arundo donax TaxID=35708 RepID=A0A0A8YEF8_ARUDO
MSHPLLIHIHAGNDHERDKLHGADRGEQPVEVVEVRAVEVVGEPARPALLGGAVDGGDDEAAEEVSHAEDAEEEGEPEAAQSVGHLVVKELLQPNHGEHVREPEQNVLRHHPPEAHGQLRLGLVHQAGVPRHAEPPHLHEGRHDHGDQREDEPRADPLQHGDPRGQAREPPRQGHERAVVHRDEGHNGDADERLQRRRRHPQRRADPPVQRRGLLREERRRLREDHGVDDARRPDGEQAQHAFHFFPVPGVVARNSTLTLARFRAFDHRDERSGKASKGARFGRRVVAVTPGPEQEHDEREDHDEAGDAKAKAPADVVLDVAGHHGGHGGAGAHAEVPPVEEGAPRHGLLGVVLVELVRAERLRAGLVPGLGQRHQVQGDVEDGHLDRGRGARERFGGVAAAVVVERRERGDGQHAHAHDEEEGGEHDGAVPPEPGVGHARHQQRQHRRHPAPRVDRRRRARRRLPQRASQVADQVRRHPVIREPLRDLHTEDEHRGGPAAGAGPGRRAPTEVHRAGDGAVGLGQEEGVGDGVGVHCCSVLARRRPLRVW